LKPTWSIKSLLEPAGEPISDKQFRHLLTLARLNIPNKEQETKLKAEIDQLTQFTEHIKKLDIAVDQPLTHIWKDNIGQILRDDNQVESLKQVRGRDLLNLAKKKSGNFYVVKGSMPSSE
jgi:aspartyl/glutamyl-tRNA(Asn/Gln) amidotransferase C subunit